MSRHPRERAGSGQGISRPATARRSYLALAGVCTFWGTIPVLAAEVDLPAVAIVFVRVWVAALALGAVILLQPAGPGRPRPFSHRWPLCLAAGAILAVHWTAMFAAYQRAPSDTVIFVIFLAPVGVAVLAPRTLGEVLGPTAVLALALALGGLALVAAPRLDTGGTGLALAGVAAATLVALVLVSKPLARVYGGLRLTFIEMAVAGVALLPVAAGAGWGRPQASWGWLVVLGLVHTAAGTAVYLGALGRVPATSVGIMGYLEPAGVVLFNWLLLGRPPGLTTVAGGLMIVAAGALVLRSAPAAPPVEAPARVPG